MDGFHTHDGFYWRRREDGSVAIVVRESGKADAPILREHYLPANEWASVVSSVSARGENTDTLHEAENFHNKSRP